MAEDSDTDFACQFGLRLASGVRDHTSFWKQPWETALVAHKSTPAAVCKAKGPLPLVQPEPNVDQDATQSSGLHEKSEGLKQVCTKMARFKHESWSVMLNEERNLAVNKWLRIILVELLAFAVARNFYASKASGLTGGTLADSIADCLAPRATSTAHARGNSVLRFVKRAKAERHLIFPPMEGVEYAFFEANKDKAGATSFSSFLSVLCFAERVFGLEGAEIVYTSGRVRGLSAKLYPSKEKLCHAILSA